MTPAEQAVAERRAVVGLCVGCGNEPDWCQCPDPAVTEDESAPRSYTPGSGAERSTEQADESPLYVDVAALLSGGLPKPPTPVLLRREDGHCLFYAGKVNVLFGDPESGKSWVALVASAEALRDGRRVLVIDTDHNGAAVIVSRLLSLGAPRDALTDPAVFRYTEPEDREHLTLVVADARRWRPAVAIVDSIGEMLPLLGLSSNSPDDYTTAHRLVLLPLKRAGASVIAVDHLAQNAASRVLGPTGTLAKRRTVDGASIRVTLREAFAPGRGGCCALSINKDRNGGLRAHSPNTGGSPAPAGLFRLTERDGALAWSVSAPRAEDADAPGDDGPRGHDAERDADRLAHLDPPPESQRDVQDRMRWGGTRALNALRAYRSRSAPGAEHEKAGALRSAPTHGVAERGAEHEAAVHAVTDLLGGEEVA